MVEQQLEPTLARKMSELFGALSDPSRVRIIAGLLDQEVNVGELAGMVGMSESAVSHQLRTLRQLHLVRRRKQGREAYYTLDDEHVADLFRRGLDHVRHQTDHS
jgi:ArsR family transcriptional regulator